MNSIAPMSTPRVGWAAINMAALPLMGLVMLSTIWLAAKERRRVRAERDRADAAEDGVGVEHDRAVDHRGVERVVRLTDERAVRMAEEAGEGRVVVLDEPGGGVRDHQSVRHLLDDEAEALLRLELARARLGAADEVVVVDVRALEPRVLVRADLQPLEFVMALAKLTRPQIELSDEAMPNLVPRLVAVFMAGLRPDGTDLPV